MNCLAKGLALVGGLAGRGLARKLGFWVPAMHVCVFCDGVECGEPKHNLENQPSDFLLNIPKLKNKSHLHFNTTLHSAHDMATPNASTLLTYSPMTWTPSSES